MGQIAFANKLKLSQAGWTENISEQQFWNPVMYSWLDLLLDVDGDILTYEYVLN